MTGGISTHRPMPYIRAVTHVHTRHSPDSVIRHDHLGAVMVGAGIDLVLVADHDTFEGSVQFAAHCEREELAITVPVAAEVRTDRGDVLVVLEPGTTPPPVGDLLSWESLVEIVREQDGVIGLPHPYRSHTGVEEMAEAVDFIEVFNARTGDDDNRRASSLCEAVGAYRSYGVDAHLARELTSVVVEYPLQPTIRKTLLQHALCAAPGRTPRSNKAAAEVVAGINQRRPIVTAYFGLKYLRLRTGELLSKS